MFSPWQVRCGIADYTAHLVEALRALDDVQVSVVPFDRRPHPRSDYADWGRRMNTGDVAHIQHEYAFFGYLLPWRNHFRSFISQIRRPLVITKHVSFDGPLTLVGQGWLSFVRRAKWSMYNRWLGAYATYLNRDTFDVARQIIVLDTHLKDQLIVRGIRSEKINVIPPGVPRVPRAMGGERLRAEWGWSDKRIIGQFGFITPAKGHALALDVVAHLPDDHVLLVAGGLRREADRGALDAVRQRIARLNLEDRVRITGYLNAVDVPAHIHACDVLIYPYTHVDSSYSVMTGLAYQTVPVIISDVSAHRELAERRAGVELFRSGDPADLRRAIQSVLNDEERRAAMRRDTLRFAQEYSWQAIARKTREVYLRALQD